MTQAASSVSDFPSYLTSCLVLKSAAPHALSVSPYGTHTHTHTQCRFIHQCYSWVSASAAVSPSSSPSSPPSSSHSSSPSPLSQSQSSLASVRFSQESSGRRETRLTTSGSLPPLPITAFHQTGLVKIKDPPPPRPPRPPPHHPPATFISVSLPFASIPQSENLLLILPPADLL